MGFALMRIRKTMLEKGLRTVKVSFTSYLIELAEFLDRSAEKLFNEARRTSKLSNIGKTLQTNSSKTGSIQVLTFFLKLTKDTLCHIKAG